MLVALGLALAIGGYLWVQGSFYGDSKIETVKDALTVLEKHGFYIYPQPVAIPQAELYDKAGNRARLPQGNYELMLVNLWQTICAPCIKELPELDKLVLDFHDHGLKMVLVNYGEELSEQEKFFAQVDFSPQMQFLSDPDITSGQYRATVDPDKAINGLPQTYLVKSDLTLVAALFGAVDWSNPAIRSALSILLVNT